MDDTPPFIYFDGNYLVLSLSILFAGMIGVMIYLMKRDNLISAFSKEQDDASDSASDLNSSVKTE
jgi:hypothetical protein